MGYRWKMHSVITMIWLCFLWPGAGVLASGESSIHDHDKAGGMTMEGHGNSPDQPGQQTAQEASDSGLKIYHTGQDAPTHDHKAMQDAGSGSAMSPEESTVDVIENLGSYLPPDIELIDSSGKRHTIKTIIDKPTILVLIYFSCPSACTIIQGNLASTLNHVPSKLGRDFQVISVSFDSEETTRHARRAKTDYTKIIKPAPAPAAWRFFTAEPVEIDRITEATGFRYKKMGPQSFLHPNLVTVLSADGQIIRYLYGTDYLPFDVGMALSEALQGTPGVSIKKILSYCFEYDPDKNRYAFKLIQFSGIITLILVGGFVFFLLKKR